MQKLVPGLLLVIACAVATACASKPMDAVLAGTVAVQQPPQQATMAQAAEDEEARVRYIMRALNPRRLPEVANLRRVATGTGFFIAADRVLTNFHVAGACTAVTVGNNTEGEEIAGKLLAGDAVVDLAVLSTEEVQNVKPARFRSVTRAEQAQKLAIVGYPEHGLTVLRAELSEVSAEHPDLIGSPGKFDFSGGVRRGNSGGPVLDDSAAVVGIVTQKLDVVAVYRKTGVVADDLGIAIGNPTVLDFLNANMISYQRATAGSAGLTSGQLLDEAHSFVRQISCWK